MSFNLKIILNLRFEIIDGKSLRFARWGLEEAEV